MADTVELKSAPPSPETGSDKLPAAVVQAPRGGTETVTVDTTQAAKVDPKPTTERPAERPAWLPEGIESPEALAEAYKALQSQKTTTDPKANAEPAEQTPVDTKGAAESLQKAGLSLDEFTAEFAQSGKLSDESLSKLEKAGINRQTVDSYIEGQRARATAFQSALEQTVGGAEALQETLKWASGALSPAEIAAANKALESMDPAQAGLVVQGLNARRIAEVGQEPKFASGRSAPGRDAVVGYESSQQWISDVNSAKYRNDPAFREQVMRRVAASKF